MHNTAIVAVLLPTITWNIMLNWTRLTNALLNFDIFTQWEDGSTVFVQYRFIALNDTILSPPQWRASSPVSRRCIKPHNQSIKSKWVHVEREQRRQVFRSLISMFLYNLEEPGASRHPNSQKPSTLQNCILAHGITLCETDFLLLCFRLFNSLKA